MIDVATGQARGNALYWEYDLNLDVGDSVWQVRFSDWMFREDERVVINRATVSKFGLTIGEVTIFFYKQ